jgi:hypothetical protein
MQWVMLLLATGHPTVRRPVRTPGMQAGQLRSAHSLKALTQWNILTNITLTWRHHCNAYNERVSSRERKYEFPDLLVAKTFSFL